MSLDAGTLATLVALLVSVLATIAGGLGSALAKRTSQVEFLGPGLETKFQATDDPTKDSRLADTRRALDRQESLAKWNSRAAASLTFGQYIVGGVLASSFVQESLTPQVVGLLGVLVLISSLIHQRYRPDLQGKRGQTKGTSTSSFGQKG